MYGRAMTPIGMWSLLGAASGYSPSSPSSAMSTIALARQFVDHALELAKRKIAILFSHSPAERGPVARGHVVPAASAAYPTAQCHR